METLYKQIDTTLSSAAADASWSSICSTSLEAVDMEDLEIWRVLGPSRSQEIDREVNK